VDNLEREGLATRARLVGDTMFDALLQYATIAQARSRILETLQLQSKGYVVATVHRAYNTDDLESLHGILTALSALQTPVVFPVHPRTRARIAALNGNAWRGDHSNVRLIEPLSYLDMLQLEQNAKLVLTDSGGVQKEAFYLAVPCVTLRPETEWVETVATGWNVVAGTEPRAIVRAVQDTEWPVTAPPRIFGDGTAAQRIVSMLLNDAAA
jgi:UDP-N-acetylglucosamine 2-epimerase